MTLRNYTPEARKRLFDHMREEVGPLESNYINVCNKCKRAFRAKLKGERICPKCEKEDGI